VMAHICDSEYDGDLTFVQAVDIVRRSQPGYIYLDIDTLIGEFDCGHMGGTPYLSGVRKSI